ncbi:Methyltransferase ustM-like protein [Cladobotryum mycophilum]|uniref:Methyltransferase ustM-like protein n=1 Tax=Cladobotryum mycophilum TaxID=491253 RepID=A0ABR0STK5_9HYPO
MTSSATFEPIQASAAAAIAGYSIAPKEHMGIQIPQAEHRINFVNFWKIAPGSRVLEIGCGQGDCTAVLAEAVGPTGHVDAVDPGRPDYGAPWTLAQAQAHLSASSIGDRISWHFAEPTKFLADHAGENWDYVVFAHCIWYFESPTLLDNMLAALKGRATNLLIAEYALKATEKDAVPHVLAAVARATLEAHNKASEANIRCLSSPAAIADAAKDKGWTLGAETIIVPAEGLLDGSWEVGPVKSKGFLEEVEEHIEDLRVKALLHSARDAVIGVMESQGVTKARTMDVWIAKFN